MGALVFSPPLPADSQGGSAAHGQQMIPPAHSAGPSPVNQGPSSQKRPRGSLSPGRLRGGSRSSVRSRGQGVSSSSDDDDDPVMQALSKSRVAERRRHQSSGSSDRGSPRSSAAVSGYGSPTHSIELTSPHHSDHEGSESVDPAANISDRRGSGHPSDDGSSTRSTSSPSSQASASTGRLLSATALVALPATRVPRNQWIPGYVDRRNFVAADVAPWALPKILQLSVRELTVDLLFQKFSKPALWIFPPDERAPMVQHWLPNLITESNVRTLYAATPRDVIDAVVAPVSFDLVDWFQVMANQYMQVDEDFRQELWGSTHVFPITTSLRKCSPFFNELADNRKQRRSLWSSLEVASTLMLRGIVAGHCVLDVFLGRFFLHFPRTGEKKFWFPGTPAH
ncbi:hypothetical protein PF005_g8580 [Phytophthora fragariae]|uniref:Uncharacterized protein n=2 Tax=Phytophthora fragariae TaxID=53985 RepID=A0A6A3ZQP9_9STRA|nr:hypothetical protein PF003_g32387 [Phytophthora fragariae]KAE8940320.1 hypothetical protein PF009_g9861 [Phytophthora fragariae]KAE8982531.1 hypothetical protein PF011_g21579 [Phytophthora fragariae]KAE9114834.1 hypothetical protein PF010_g9567 [Phytophthora fragariae]KAE9117907.1 hypothetical protein PF007_g9116 [Phytophthora fragariae]